MIKLLQLVPQYILEENEPPPVASKLVKPLGDHAYSKAASDGAGEPYTQKYKDFSPKQDQHKEGGDEAGIIKT